MIISKKIIFLILSVFFTFKINIINAIELGDYDSSARNASVIAYGKSQDGETYILFAHEIYRAGWTPPGGARDASHRTILDTAASELYEETAAFPGFDPLKIKALLKKQDSSCVYNLASSNTDYFALNIGDKIDQCHNIAVNYQQRIAGKSRSFYEMDQWKRVNVKDLYAGLSAQPQPVANRHNVPGIGVLRGYVFNGLWQFYRAGLKNVIDSSIANSNSNVTVLTTGPFVPKVTKITTVPVTPVKSQFSRFNGIFQGFGAAKTSTPLLIASKSLITPATPRFSGFNNIFRGFGVARTTPSAMTSTTPQFLRFNSIFGGFRAARTSSSVMTSTISQSSGFNNFKGFRSVKTSTPAIGTHKSTGSFFSSFRKTQTPVSKNQGLKFHQTHTFLNLFKLLNK